MKELQNDFEEALRASARQSSRPIGVSTVSGGVLGGEDIRARLSRISRGAPEVIVKVTGRTRDARQLRDQLNYISRKGSIDLEDSQGVVLSGPEAIGDLAEDWSATAKYDRRLRAVTPFSRSLVLSSPPASDPLQVRDASRHVAVQMLGERFDYVLALHTDSSNPHVHLTVRALGDQGEHLGFRRAELACWRQEYALALRMRGIEVEATSRAFRGLMPKLQHTDLRWVDDLYAAGKGPMARVRRHEFREAAAAAFLGDTALKPWEARALERQLEIRALYVSQARLLQGSEDPGDRALGDAVLEFVRKMPAPESRRLALAKELKAADAKARSNLVVQGRSLAEEGVTSGPRRARETPEREAGLER